MAFLYRLFSLENMLISSCYMMAFSLQKHCFCKLKKPIHALCNYFWMFI